MHSAVLLAQENKELRASNEHLTRKRRRRRTQIQQGGVLQVQEAQNLILGVESREQENIRLV